MCVYLMGALLMLGPRGFCGKGRQAGAEWHSIRRGALEGFGGADTAKKRVKIVECTLQCTSGL